MPRTYSPFLTYLLWALIVVGIAVVAFINRAPLIALLSPSQQGARITPALTLSGYILMSYADLGTQTSYLYKFDAANQALQQTTLPWFNPGESVDGQYIVSTYILPSTPGLPRGVYLYNLQSATGSLFVRGVAQYSRTPQLSPDDSMVVFDETTAASSSPTFYDPTSWNMYVWKDGGPAQLIAHGIYPHWSPDGSSIVYLAKDGLHQYTLTTSKDAIVYSMHNGNASTPQVFNLSKDGKEIVWTDPIYGQLYIGNVTSWKPFTFAFFYHLGAYAYWPVFSPDDDEIAFEQFDSSASSTNATVPWLTVFDLRTDKSEQLLNLSEADQQTLFITDWVKTL